LSRLELDKYERETHSARDLADGSEDDILVSDMMEIEVNGIARKV
jgi:hypothetical protein